MLQIRTGQHFGLGWEEYGDYNVESNATLPTTSEYTLVLTSPAAVSLIGQSVVLTPTIQTAAATLTLEVQVLGLMATMPANYAAVSMTGQTVNLTYTPPGGGGYVPRPLWAGVWEGVWRGVQ